MILQMRYYGDPILRKIASPVKRVTKDIEKLVDDMIETMDAYQGIGIAAPQVGHLLRIFIIRLEWLNDKGEFVQGIPKAYINPKIITPDKKLKIMSEGCLSLPKIHVDVSRPISIQIEALDKQGNPIKEELHDFTARQFMHENDHLNGTLIIDRCPKEQRKEHELMLRDLKKQYKVSQVRS